MQRILRRLPIGCLRMQKRLTEFKEVRHIKEMLFPWFDEKDTLEDGVLYIVDSDDQREQSVLYKCPCGCGGVVHIPYFHADQQKELCPSWAYREAEGKVTLSPSVYSSGFLCKSHYFIRDNKIIWC